MSSSESDAMSEEIEESEVEELTSDTDDASTEVEEPSDESSENNDEDDDDDGNDDATSVDEDLDVQTQDVLEKKRKKPDKKTLMLENEINNHAVYEGASLISYQILMNEEEQKVFFEIGQLRKWPTLGTLIL